MKITKLLLARFVFYFRTDGEVGDSKLRVGFPINENVFIEGLYLLIFI